MQLGFQKILVFTGIFASFAASSGFAENTPIPICNGYGYELPVNNRQVLHWKRTTENQFRERAHVRGKVVKLHPRRKEHVHFEIQLGKRPTETIEVIYNQDFGKLSDPEIGMMAQACGDYITATAQSGHYPPSPAGAIIHWIHGSPDEKKHQPGFLVLDGKLYGQEMENIRPRTHEFESLDENVESFPSAP